MVKYLPIIFLCLCYSEKCDSMYQVTDSIVPRERSELLYLYCTLLFSKVPTTYGNFISAVHSLSSYEFFLYQVQSLHIPFQSHYFRRSNFNRNRDARKTKLGILLAWATYQYILYTTYTGKRESIVFGTSQKRLWPYFFLRNIWKILRKFCFLRTTQKLSTIIRW
jgi:hypothetical protein